jgi:hypothetical protein
MSSSAGVIVGDGVSNWGVVLVGEGVLTGGFPSSLGTGELLPTGV